MLNDNVPAGRGMYFSDGQQLSYYVDEAKIAAVKNRLKRVSFEYSLKANIALMLMGLLLLFVFQLFRHAGDNAANETKNIIPFLDSLNKLDTAKTSAVHPKQ